MVEKKINTNRMIEEHGIVSSNIFYLMNMGNLHTCSVSVQDLRVWLHLIVLMLIVTDIVDEVEDIASCTINTSMMHSYSNPFSF